MKKIPLEAISKNDGMFSLVLVKNERSLQVIRRFLIAIGFEKMESSKILHPLGDADNNYDLRPYSDKLYEDVSFAFITKGFYVHLAFGLKKILLAIYCRTRGGSARLNRQLWEYFEIRSLG